jgi:hypothetical protein
VDRVIIRWPSGRQQTIERPQIDMLHRVTEPFDSAQGRPFDSAQGRPFDAAQGRPDGL